MRDALLILSGGMDSVTLLHERREEIALALTFDYGANHGRQETRCARLNCEKLQIEHILVSLPFVPQLFQSSLLSGAEAIPEGRYDEQSMKSTVVPFRNGIMLSIACGIAESRGLRRVMMANHSGDHTVYPDCRPSFVEAMDKAMQEGTWERLRLDAPYTRLTKTDIARRGKELGVDYALTWSCYKGLDRHCGRCGTCRERREALRDAGIDDPTEYLD
ncbi:MAG: 7-cyano-7-deazaguanine synthase QueC [Prevotellaceae bacterium]|nr:7-cyano-7-deazaguanine synthase QueC [Prevotellaceae bacterium]